MTKHQGLVFLWTFYILAAKPLETQRCGYQALLVQYQGSQEHRALAVGIKCPHWDWGREGSLTSSPFSPASPWSPWKPCSPCGEGRRSRAVERLPSASHPYLVPAPLHWELLCFAHSHPSTGCMGLLRAPTLSAWSSPCHHPPPRLGAAASPSRHWYPTALLARGSPALLASPTALVSHPSRVCHPSQGDRSVLESPGARLHPAGEEPSTET